MASTLFRQPGSIKQTSSLSPYSKSNKLISKTPTPHYHNYHHEHDHNQQHQYSNKQTNQCQSELNFSNRNITDFPSQINRCALDLSHVVQLNLDHNSLCELSMDPHIFANLTWLSAQHNNMQKFNIARKFRDTSQCSTMLGYVNLSNNMLQFVDLSQMQSLQQIIVSHNHLQTILLPQDNLEVLNINHNNFSNIQYSVLSIAVNPNINTRYHNNKDGSSFGKLKQLHIESNKSTLYDLVLAVEGRQMAPNLRVLQANHNIISHVQALPDQLQQLGLAYNEFVMHRQHVNQIVRLKQLKKLDISGNYVPKQYLDIIQSKIGGDLEIVTNSHQQQQQQLSKIHPIKQSPYRLYHNQPILQQPVSDYYDNALFKNNSNNNHSSHNHNKKTTINTITYSNFTLGDENQNIDPEYNLTGLVDTPRLPKDDQIDSQDIQAGPKQCQIIEQNECKNVALKEAQNKLQSTKYRLKIEGLRYENHYRMYLQKLLQFMAIPPVPVSHNCRSVTQSVRIDPPQQQPERKLLSEFNLVHEMFQSRGGIHYLRKLFNWERSRRIAKDQTVPLFINCQLDSARFQALCEGNTTQIQSVLQYKRYCISAQPSSFSVYHVLARLNTLHTDWSCLYLIEAVHL